MARQALTGDPGPLAALANGIAASSMDAVFPFRLVFDRELTILEAGCGLAKVCRDVAPGQRLGERFRLVTPDIPLEFDSVCGQIFTVYFVEHLASKLVLKGQMLRAGEGSGELLMFLCSPVVRDMASVADLGLALDDFAIHDSVVDFLVLLQTKINTINDVRHMAERLRKEVTVRREAETELKAINQDLEARVARRTQELRGSNKSLKREISERKRVDEELRIVNAQLKAWVHKLERHNREISLLNKMGDMLQACRTVEETYRVIADSVQQLFPADGGQLILLDETEDEYEVVAEWGGLKQMGERFTREACWALRRARYHHREPKEVKALCGHVKGMPKGGYLCVPLMAQGNLLGALHLQCNHAACAQDQEGTDAITSREEQRQLIQTASEHIGLAIANLRLQETLRIQSIRDSLTGLYNRRHMEDALEREVHRAQRHDMPVGVILLDVDHFKRFNDSYGHQAGDYLLSELGVILQGHVRGEDIACRYGGEEFILILPGADAEQTTKRAEDLRAMIENHLHLSHAGVELPAVTISAGVACLPDHGKSAIGVVGAADKALYKAKKEGRNRVVRASGKKKRSHKR